MSDYLERQALRALGKPPAIRPRLLSLYEPVAESTAQDDYGPATTEVLEESAPRQAPNEPVTPVRRPRNRPEQGPCAEPVEPFDGLNDSSADFEDRPTAATQRNAVPRERGGLVSSASDAENGERPFLGQPFKKVSSAVPLAKEEQVAKDAEAAGRAAEARDVRPAGRMMAPEDRRIDAQRTLPAFSSEGRAFFHGEQKISDAQPASAQSASVTKTPLDLPALEPSDSIEGRIEPRTVAMRHHARTRESDGWAVEAPPHEEKERPASISITIGRVEIRALTPPAAPAPSAAPPKPRISLDEYLKNGGSR